MSSRTPESATITQHSKDEIYERSRAAVGYVPRSEATVETYEALGFKCGLEVHQQLKTDKKLFCRCPAGIYQKGEDFDSEIVRHMRPTLSELGEYDGTALMEFKTRKNIIYRLKYQTACTYDIDDTPPFAMNREALFQALEIALLLNMKIVGELHIARKQYLDGSIPTGFQRTGIIGIGGEIPLSNKTVRMIQLSIEEDSCREVSDIGHWRTYSTDRVGTPLIESVTYPEMLTPDEAAEAGQYIRFLARSTGKVRTGPGAARQDVNVSITGGTRVEIKGVSGISMIPELTHNEAFRQKALLKIKEELRSRIGDTDNWQLTHRKVEADLVSELSREHIGDTMEAIAISLPGFSGLLSHFTQPGQTFADELSARLKVIACLERPNMYHSDQGNGDDAELFVWGPGEDIPTAIETIEERCRLAFEGVPNETRKALVDGTTIFERVLPGPDRMYPDTDSAPISISREMIESCREALPKSVAERVEQLKRWKAPSDTHQYLLRNNFVPLIEELSNSYRLSPRFLSCLLAHTFKHVAGGLSGNNEPIDRRIKELCQYTNDMSIEPELLRQLLPVMVKEESLGPDEILDRVGFEKKHEDDIVKLIPETITRARELMANTSDSTKATDWIMGQLRPAALGNIPMSSLRTHIVKALENV